MRSLAIIPARAGSKRVPGKNLCEVGGKSLLHRAIDSARICNQTVVSTDSDEVRAAVAREIDGWVLRDSVGTHARKPEHATDDATLEDVIADVLDATGYMSGGDDRAVVLLQPTSPFRTSEHVWKALSMLEAGASCVVSVTPLHNLFPAFSGEVFNGTYYPRNTTAARRASSDLQHLCYENGAIYAFTLAHWRQHRKRLHNEAAALVMHWSESVEIDTESDLRAARALAEGMAPEGVP